MLNDKTLYYAIAFAIVMPFLASCASQPDKLEVAPEDWKFKDRAIFLEFKAPADLNAYNGRPHALAVGIYQLNDPNTFSGLSATREGAVELLRKGKLDDTIVHFTRITVQPGEHKSIVLNRAETAQYVGMISGYFGLSPTNDVELFPIPVKASKRGLVENGLAAVKLIADEAKAKPKDLYLNINLGRDSTKQMVIIEPLNRITSKAKKRNKPEDKKQ
ncbi:MAG: type VI secretion system lipoprotein TssJ [Ectothiorhodospiraceae bacterium]|nr:type VI secretion system lipoprotein TssJ [Ectothiorhodospiraceae bacterium]